MDKDRIFKVWGKVVVFCLLLSFVQMIYNALALGGFDIGYLFSQSSFWLYILLAVGLHLPIAIPLIYFSFKKED